MKTYIRVIDSLNNIHTFIKEEHYYEWEVEQNILVLHIYKIQKDEDYIIVIFFKSSIYRLYLKYDYEQKQSET